MKQLLIAPLAAALALAVVPGVASAQDIPPPTDNMPPPVPIGQGDPLNIQGDPDVPPPQPPVPPVPLEPEAPPAPPAPARIDDGPDVPPPDPDPVPLPPDPAAGR